MAFIDPSLISDPREQKWVDEISKIFNHVLDINDQTPSVTIFQVPETITTQKPEAYEPQQLGLGPNHHFRPRPYQKMEQKKLAAMRRVLPDIKMKDFKLVVLDNVRKLVPVVRACYDMFLPDDDDSLAWVFAIDGLFLFDLFHAYNNPEDTTDSNFPRERRRFEVDPARILLAHDIMMAENQIPFMVLMEIYEALHSLSSNSFHSGNNLSPSIFRSFCEVHSPFALCPWSQAPTRAEHLLDYMYYSISKHFEREDLENPVGYAPRYDFFIAKILNFLKTFPKDMIVQLYEQIVSTLETFSRSENPFPSASKLQNRAGFKFHDLHREGIWKIDIKKKDFYLPCVTLHRESEVTLRNLVAYETLKANSDNFPLTEYVGLMCALIMNVDDVKLLREKSIILGELGDDEVAKLFIGMSSSITSMETEEVSELQKKIEEVKQAYESRLTMKIYFLLKKLANWLLVVLTAIGGFVGASWKIVAFMVSIVTVFMLTRQAYCDAFGCDKTKDTLLAYASR